MPSPGVRLPHHPPASDVCTAGIIVDHVACGDQLADQVGHNIVEVVVVVEAGEKEHQTWTGRPAR